MWPRYWPMIGRAGVTWTGRASLSRELHLPHPFRYLLVQKRPRHGGATLLLRRRGSVHPNAPPAHPQTRQFTSSTPPDREPFGDFAQGFLPETTGEALRRRRGGGSGRGRRAGARSKHEALLRESAVQLRQRAAGGNHPRVRRSGDGRGWLFVDCPKLNNILSFTSSGFHGGRCCTTRTRAGAEGSDS